MAAICVADKEGPLKRFLQQALPPGLASILDDGSLLIQVSIQNWGSVGGLALASSSRVDPLSRTRLLLSP
jgi:hypothetical protein